MWGTPRCVRGGSGEEGVVRGWSHDDSSFRTRYLSQALAERFRSVIPGDHITSAGSCACSSSGDEKTDTARGFLRLPRLHGRVVAEKGFETGAVWLDIGTPTWVLATVLEVSESEVSL